MALVQTESQVLSQVKCFHPKKITLKMFLKSRGQALLRVLTNQTTKNFFSSSASAPALSEKLEISEVSTIAKHINPLEHPDYFNVANLFTVRDLFEARVHFGHKDGSLDAKMKPYIYGSRLGHLIFDLDQTAEHLRRALNVTAHTAFQGGLILFFCRNALNAHNVEKAAMECGEFSHTRYWRGGVFTNANIQFKAVTRLPDLCIFLNTLTTVLTQHTAVRDAAKINIPTIGIVDSNCSPELITYLVPGNDDSPASIDLYCKLFKEAILRGKQKREQFLSEMEKNIEIES